MTNIKFEKISFGYNKKEKILNSINFEIVSKENKRGYVCALMGESGTGKSTILKLILGLLKPNEGRINIHPQNPVISYLPQEPVLFEHLSPMNNALYFSNIKHYQSRFDANIFKDVVKLLELEDVLNSNKEIVNLSGGEKQRISLLRALTINPNIILLDEPCTGLDIRVKHQFLIGIKELIEKYNLFVLYVTHLKDEVELIADDVLYLMKNEEIGCVDDIVYDSVDGFLTQPRNCEAGYIFHLPKMNLLKFSVVKNQISSNGDLYYYLLFGDEDLLFKERDGIKYKIIATTNQFLFLLLEEFGQTIITRKKNIANSGYLAINGKTFLYNASKVLISSVLINNNEIVL